MKDLGVDWAEGVAKAMIHECDTSRQGALGFENRPVAMQMQRIITYVCLGLNNGYDYNVRAEPMNDSKYPNRWQVIVERREIEGNEGD